MSVHPICREIRRPLYHDCLTFRLFAKQLNAVRPIRSGRLWRAANRDAEGFRSNAGPTASASTWILPKPVATTSVGIQVLQPIAVPRFRWRPAVSMPGRTDRHMPVRRLNLSRLGTNGACSNWWKMTEGPIANRPVLAGFSVAEDRCSLRRILGCSHRAVTVTVHTHFPETQNRVECIILRMVISETRLCDGHRWADLLRVMQELQYPPPRRGLNRPTAKDMPESLICCGRTSGASERELMRHAAQEFRPPRDGDRTYRPRC